MILDKMLLVLNKTGCKHLKTELAKMADTKLRDKVKKLLFKESKKYFKNMKTNEIMFYWEEVNNKTDEYHTLIDIVFALGEEYKKGEDHFNCFYYAQVVQNRDEVSDYGGLWLNGFDVKLKTTLCLDL